MIGAVVLAAGGSRRLGRPKQLVKHRGITLLRRSVVAALDAGCEPIVVVIGGIVGDLRAELSDLPVEVVINGDWAQGIAGSIRIGIAALAARRQVGAAVLLGCDQPHLCAATIGRLVDAFDRAPGRMVASQYSGTVGIPALFERACFPQLERLDGDRGAKNLLQAGGAKTLAVPWEVGLIDVDTPGDVERLGRE